MNSSQAAHWVRQFANQRVAVVGDILLDEYVIGRASRISREAPIPVLEFEERRYIAGGAANPALNISSLGGAAAQISVVGADESAVHLRDLLQKAGIDPCWLVTADDRPTTLKTRLMARMGLRFPQQVARVDTLSREPVSPEVEARICQLIAAHAADFDAVLVSDYRGGMLTATVVNALRSARQPHGPILAVDAQGLLHKYRRFDLVKCNADDAAAYLGRSLVTDTDFEQAAHDLVADLELYGAMVITRGADGATLARADHTSAHCPARNVSDVYDTVGAGDTAIAVMTLALAAGADYAEAVLLANVASGIVVRHVGNYTPAADELLANL